MTFKTQLFKLFAIPHVSVRIYIGFGASNGPVTYIPENQGVIDCYLDKKIYTYFHDQEVEVCDRGTCTAYYSNDRTVSAARNADSSVKFNFTIVRTVAESDL